MWPLVALTGDCTNGFFKKENVRPFCRAKKNGHTNERCKFESI